MNEADALKPRLNKNVEVLVASVKDNNKKKNISSWKKLSKEGASGEKVITAEINNLRDLQVDRLHGDRFLCITLKNEEKLL